MNTTTTQIGALMLAIACFARTGYYIECEYYIRAFLMLGLGIFNIGLFFIIEIKDFIRNKY